jgi:hypothetical protein
MQMEGIQDITGHFDNITKVCPHMIITSVIYLHTSLPRFIGAIMCSYNARNIPIHTSTHSMLILLVAYVCIYACACGIHACV